MIATTPLNVARGLFGDGVEVVDRTGGSDSIRRDLVDVVADASPRHPHLLRDGSEVVVEDEPVFERWATVTGRPRP
jgi:hypothetical protein